MLKTEVQNVQKEAPVEVESQVVQTEQTESDTSQADVSSQNLQADSENSYQLVRDKEGDQTSTKIWLC